MSEIQEFNTNTFMENLYTSIKPYAAKNRIKVKYEESTIKFHIFMTCYMEMECLSREKFILRDSRYPDEGNIQRNYDLDTLQMKQFKKLISYIVKMKKQLKEYRTRFEYLGIKKLPKISFQFFYTNTYYVFLYQDHYSEKRGHYKLYDVFDIDGQFVLIPDKPNSYIEIQFDI